MTDALLKAIVVRRVFSLFGDVSIQRPRYVERQIDARVVTIPLKPLSIATLKMVLICAHRKVTAYIE